MKTPLPVAFALLIAIAFSSTSAFAQVCQLEQARCGDELPIIVDRDFSDDAPDYSGIWEVPYNPASTAFDVFDLPDSGSYDITFTYCIEAFSDLGHFIQYRGVLTFAQNGSDIVGTALHPVHGWPLYGDDQPSIDIRYQPTGVSQDRMGQSDFAFYPECDGSNCYMSLSLWLTPWPSLVSGLDPNHVVLRGTMEVEAQ